MERQAEGVIKKRKSIFYIINWLHEPAGMDTWDDSSDLRSNMEGIIMIKTLRIACVVAAMALLGGCAASRSVVLPDAGTAIENPAQGLAVRIDKVEDARRFEAAPNTPDIPSLPGNDLLNSSLTSRAIGRKRGGFGLALGDVLLPEGQTVSQLVRDAVAQGFRRAGYRVLAAGEPGYEQATPITARINEFWSWFNPGFAQVTIKNRASIDVAGTLPPLKGGVTIRSEVSEGMQAVFEDDWRKIAGKGLVGITEKIQAVLNPKPN